LSSLSTTTLLRGWGGGGEKKEEEGGEEKKDAPKASQIPPTSFEFKAFEDARVLKGKKEGEKEEDEEVVVRMVLA